jgi:hypothetical protein
MLTTKLKRAERAIGDARQAYIGLENSLDPLTVKAWKEAEGIAMKEQGEHLRIFEVKMKKGISVFPCPTIA